MDACAGCSKVRLGILPKRRTEAHTMRGNRQQASQNRGRDQPGDPTGRVHQTRSGRLDRSILARLAEGGGTETLALYTLRKYRHLKVSFAGHRVLRPGSPFNVHSACTLRRIPQHLNSKNNPMRADKPSFPSSSVHTLIPPIVVLFSESP